LGVDQLRSFLRRHRRIGLDTSIFIYQLEANPRYVALADSVFSWVERSGHEEPGLRRTAEKLKALKR